MRSVPLIYRIILLGLLPCIAAVLYVRGQYYDSALIDFKKAEGTLPQSAGASSQPLDKTISAAAEKEIAAPENPGFPGASGITGFRLLGGEHRYTRENLYEHVDGHAEYFIGAGFVGLTVTEYVVAVSRTEQPDIQVEVYDMGKGIQAFGVLVDESGENPRAVSVGTMGFSTSGGVNFIKGRYYVKINAYNSKAPALKFAEEFSDTLSTGQDSFSKVFSRFPDLGKVEKTRFVKEGYRGLDFLHNVIERGYSTGEKKITVALMTGSQEEMKSLLASFMDYFKKSGISYEKTERDGIEAYRVKDKYEGNWFLIPGKSAVFGLFGTDDEGTLKFFAKGTR